MALTQERRENLTKLAAMKEGWGSAKDSGMKKFLRKEVAPRTSMASNRLSAAKQALAGRRFKKADDGSSKAKSKKTIAMLAKRILGLEGASTGKGGKQMEGELGGKSMAGLGGKQSEKKLGKTLRRGGRQSEKKLGKSDIDFSTGGGNQMKGDMASAMRKSMKRMSYARK